MKIKVEITSEFKKIIRKLPYKNDLPIVAVLIVVICLFLVPPFQLNDLGGDFNGTTVPWYHFLYTSIRHLLIPFWSPYAYLGIPFLLTPSLAFFNPLSLLIIFLNFIFNLHNPSIEVTGQIIEYVMVFALCIGATGMYIFCRKILNVSKLPALFAGVVFSLNPFLIHDLSVPVTSGFSLLPWIFLVLVLFLSKPNFKLFAAIVFLNFLILTTGYPYIYVYFILAEVFFALFYGFKKAALFLLSLINSTLLGGFFLLSYIMIFLQSGRSENIYDFTWHSFASQFPTGVPLIFAPLTYSSDIGKYADIHQIFSGAVLTFGTFAFVFLIYGLFRLKNKPIYMWSFITFFITLFYSFGSNLSTHSFFGTILPVIYKFRSHNRIFLLTVFAGTILIALGIEAISKRFKVKSVDIGFWSICILIFLGLILGPVFFWSKIAATAEFYKGVSIMFLFLFSSLIIIVMTRRYGGKAFLILGLIILLIEYHYYFPREKGYFMENVTYEKFYQFNSTIPEMPSSNNLFRIYFDDNRFTYNSSVIGQYGLQGYENNTPNVYGELMHNMYGWSSKFWQLMNVKYIITTNADFGINIPELKEIRTINPSEYPDQFSPKDYGITYHVFEVKNYLPRFYIPKKVEPCLDLKCWVKENAPELVLAQGISNSIVNPKKGVNINIEKYSLNNIEIDINTPKTTFIASSETYDKGWSLFVNNKPQTIYVVSSGLRGFIVPAGKSVVKMNYFPPYAVKGFMLSILGIILLYLNYRYLFSKKINGKDNMVIVIKDFFKLLKIR